MRVKDIKKGVRCGKLVAVKPAGKREDRRHLWEFKCDCGNKKILRVNEAGRRTNSCGHCGRPEGVPSDATGGKYHKLHRMWGGMVNRCYNANTEQYPHYGGRGITVCEEWKNDYYSFKKWALSVGYDYKLNGYQQSIDRISVNGNYCPNNCRFVDIKIQNRNKTNNKYLMVNNVKMTHAEANRALGFPEGTITKRYSEGKRGSALTVPMSKPKTVLVDGELLTCQQISKKYSIKQSTVSSRFYRGWSAHDIIYGRGK